MNRILLATAALALFGGSALAQTAAPPPEGRGAGSGSTVVRERGNTGGDGNTVVAPGATGAETIESDSAAGGNADQPERRVPQGSGGGR